MAAEAAADAAVAWRKAGDPRKAAAAERRAHTLAARCEGARTPALAAVSARAALSARKLEIARLAAAGVPNKEIAARLYLSLHTVQNKLHSAYEKLGVQGRAELAQALEVTDPTPAGRRCPPGSRFGARPRASCWGSYRRILFRCSSRAFWWLTAASSGPSSPRWRQCIYVRGPTTAVAR